MFKIILKKEGFKDGRKKVAEEVKKETQKMLGDGYLRLNNMVKAMIAYEAAGVEPPKDELIACGDRLLGKDQYDEAIKVYEAAEAKDELIACGDKCLRNDIHSLAVKAYRAATRLKLDK